MRHMAHTHTPSSISVDRWIRSCGGGQAVAGASVPPTMLLCYRVTARVPRLPLTHRAHDHGGITSDTQRLATALSINFVAASARHAKLGHPLRQRQLVLGCEAHHVARGAAALHLAYLEQPLAVGARRRLAEERLALRVAILLVA